jgi:hypothetical protein
MCCCGGEQQVQQRLLDSEDDQQHASSASTSGYWYRHEAEHDGSHGEYARSRKRATANGVRAGGEQQRSSSEHRHADRAPLRP